MLSTFPNMKNIWWIIRLLLRIWKGVRNNGSLCLSNHKSSTKPVSTPSKVEWKKTRTLNYKKLISWRKHWKSWFMRLNRVRYQRSKIFRDKAMLRVIMITYLVWVKANSNHVKKMPNLGAPVVSLAKRGAWLLLETEGTWWASKEEWAKTSRQPVGTKIRMNWVKWHQMFSFWRDCCISKRPLTMSRRWALMQFRSKRR